MWKSFLRLFRSTGQSATPISELKPGSVCCIEGVALGLPGPHPAPFSGVDAATMTIEQEHVEERNNAEIVFGSSGGTAWRNINDIDFGQTFYVRDESGIVRVDRRGWSKLHAKRQAGRKIAPELYDESLRRFRRVNAGNISLEVLEREGLDREVPEVHCWETVVPEGARVRVIGEVGSTGEPWPVGSAFPIAPATFREAPQLLEVFPGESKLSIQVL